MRENLILIGIIAITALVNGWLDGSRISNLEAKAVRLEERIVKLEARK